MKQNHNVALVTGGATNIGCEISLSLADSGYDIILHYYSSDIKAFELQQKIEQKNVNCFLIQADLTKINEGENLAKKILADYPNWNLLINNASIFQKSKFLVDDVSNIEVNMNIHLRSPMDLTKALYQNCIKNNHKGNVINLIDKNVVRHDSKYFYYLLSKKMLAEFTKISAVELAPLVRINAISPGLMVEKNSCDSEAEIKDIISKIPLKRKGEFVEIVQVIDFFLKNQFITGQNIFVDGGASLNHAG